MAKIANLQEVSLSKLVPYERNAKIHSEEQVRKIADSIQEVGFISPILIDHGYNVIAGHGRIQAAKKLGMKNVPAIFVEGLSEAQKRAYVLMDNKLTELGEWDMNLVMSELSGLASEDFDISLTGFDVDISQDWFENRERYDNTGFENESDEYKEFVEKFEPERKRTTDDCYTPDNVYDAVCSWVEKEYGVSRKNFVRPFYPGGDYQNEIYKKSDIVVDNPPFSILAEIIRYYSDNGIRFFLFAPTLTMFSSSASRNVCSIPVAAQVMYENGADVSTSFITSLEDPSLRARTAGELFKIIEKADKENRAKFRKEELPKYTYPDYVVTSAMMARYSRYGIDFKVYKCQSESIDALDSQKEEGKAIYGKGFLLSEKAAAEKAAAEKAAAEKAAAEKAAAEKAAAEKAAATRWHISDREREIIKELSKND